MNRLDIAIETLKNKVPDDGNVILTLKELQNIYEILDDIDNSIKIIIGQDM